MSTQMTDRATARVDYLAKFAKLPPEEKKRHFAIVAKRLVAVLKPLVDQPDNDLSALANDAIECDYEVDSGGEA